MATVTEDVLDPEQIRLQLPEQYRSQFLSEYREALQSAAADPGRWRELRWLLHTWRMRARTYARPGYSQRQGAAADPESSEFHDAAEVLPGWNDASS